MEHFQLFELLFFDNLLVCVFEFRHITRHYIDIEANKHFLVMPIDPSEEIDLETIELAKSGDGAAISMIINKYRKYLLFIANRRFEPILASRTSPSDVVQDTVAQLPKKILGFSGVSESELKAWLRTSLCNTLKNTHRYHFQQKRSVANETSLPSNRLEDDCTPSKELQSRERLSKIADGLKKLSPKNQELLRMRHEDGSTFTKIGEALDMSADAARMSWGRAIEKLKKHIENKSDV